LCRHDRREQLAHLVGGTARHGVAGFVADLVEMIAHLLDRECRIVEAFRPADEEPGDVPGADGVDLTGNRTFSVRQKRRHRGHQRRIELLKILGHKVIQNGLRRRVVLLAGSVDGVRQHPGVGDRSDGVDLDVVVGPLGGEYPSQADQPGLGR
jgi:hypothetical protein